MPSRPWIFVCPSSRGIGRHLTRHLLQTTTAPILATVRHGNSSSHDEDQGRHGEHDDDDDGGVLRHERLHTVHVDVRDESSIRAAAVRARELFDPATHHLHLALAIPGILTPEKSPAQIDAAACSAMFQVNTIGPLLLAKHFAEFLPRRSTDLDAAAARTAAPSSSSSSSPSSSRTATATATGDGLPAHATWVFMSARVGSVADNRTGGWYSYRASKAAVNSVAKSLDVWLQMRSGDRALAVAYHPGTVRTDFSRAFWDAYRRGGNNKQLLEPADAAARMMAVVRGLRAREDGGKCFDWKGDVVPP